MIQGTCVEEAHAHSGCVVTVIVPVPPAAPIVFGPDRETAHLTGDGATAEVDVEPQAVTATATVATTVVALRMRRADCQRTDSDLLLMLDRGLTDGRWNNIRQVNTDGPSIDGRVRSA